ncbi:MAG: ABC transporter permease [Blastocatellia bacterium]|nr:ABC transporter permease [Blastocatellia bacterium]
MKLVMPLLRKEVREIRRDPYTLGIAILLPLIQLLLFGYALNLDVAEIRLAVWDQDGSPESRAYLNSYRNTGYFQVRRHVSGYREIYESIDRGETFAALIIPADFSQRLLRGETVRVQTLVDGSFPPRAEIAVNYIEAVNEAYTERLVDSQLQKAGLGRLQEAIVAEPRVLYNSSLVSKNFIVPGLFAVILMAFPPLLSALAVTREKERGSIEQVLISPIRPYEFMIGKLLPYGAIAFVEMLVVFIAALFLFEIPFVGSIPLFLLMAVLYVLCTVGIGLLVSTVTSSQVAAMLMAIAATVMPSFLFSGFIYPIFNMPKVFQVYTYFFPARYFIEISRGIALKGVGLEYLWPNVLMLFIYTLIIVGLASIFFKKKVG